MFYDFFYSEINPVYYFYWKMNIITFAQICGGIRLWFTKRTGFWLVLAYLRLVLQTPHLV